MNTVDKVLKIAEAEVGYLEKKTNSSLDEKTANAGYNNYTKYSRDLINMIGSPYAQGVAWCDNFVDWCFIKAYGIENAKKLLGGWSAYTPTSAQYFRNEGRWFTSPQKGDVIFFKNNAGICHTGIVYDVDTLHVYTIEGNTSGANGVIANGGGVFKKSYLRLNSRIAGYGRPNYDSEAVKYTKKLPVLTAKRPILKKGMKNIQVQRLQKFLNWYFDDMVVDGRPLATDKVFGENTRKGVFKFQQVVFPTSSKDWDGEFGKRSLDKAKRVKK